MNKPACITLLSAALCALLMACTAPQTQLTEEDVSPIDYQKMAAFNTWLAEQKKLEPSKAFKAKPMQVSGKGRVRAVPDIAVITGVIRTEADQDDTAVDKAAKIINAAQEAVKGREAELNFTQIRTSEKRDTDCLALNQKALFRHYAIVSDNNYNLNIKRQLERGVDIKVEPKKAQKRLASEICPVTHIEATLSFTARIKPANEAGNIINAFTRAGVNKVDLFGYDFSDYDAHYKEASAKAVKDARTKAERVAKIAGTTLTEIVEFRIDQPQRTTRMGPQAMIITSHKNRDVAAGNYNFNDQVVSSPQYISPAPQQTYVSQPQSGGYSSFSSGVSTAYTQPVQTYTEAVIDPQRRFSQPSAYSSSQGISRANNALKMSLQAGQRTIEVNAYLNYLYETPIDGSVVPDQLN